jgi:hypothetical protein
MQVITHNALSDVLGSDGGYTQSPLWQRSDDVDSLGDNDFEQKSTQESDFEDTTVTHYENYDTIGMSTFVITFKLNGAQIGYVMQCSTGDNALLSTNWYPPPLFHSHTHTHTHHSPPTHHSLTTHHPLTTPTPISTHSHSLPHSLPLSTPHTPLPLRPPSLVELTTT